MRSIKNLLTLLILLGCDLSFSQSLPFSVYVEPMSIPGMVGVQSFCYGTNNGKWLIVGGRTDGLHKSMGMGMMGPPFPASSNNNQVIVVDPLAGQMWTTSTSTLPVDLKEQLGSTNMEYFQDGNFLYVLGGYGYKSSLSSHKTFDKITAIDVPGLIDAVINGNTISSYFRQYTDSNFQVTGGQLEKINDTYYLVGGQNFDGTYNSMGMGSFTQTYSNQIRKFTLTDDGTTLVVNHLQSITDNTNLHRRDFNMLPQILPSGEEGLTVFSGVFQTVADLPYLNCVIIDSINYSANNSFAQYFNQYQCANISMHSDSMNEMYNLFFGGMSQYYENSGQLIQDDNVPFVKTIACVKRSPTGIMNEYKLPIELPSFLGAGSEFIPDNNLSFYRNGVLKYDSLPNDTILAGYIYGGITSPSPNVFNTGMMGSNGTSSANSIFRVYIVKNAVTSDLINISSNPFLLQVFPNPSSGKVNIIFYTDTDKEVEVSLRNQSGELVWSERMNSLSGGAHKFSCSPNKNLIPGSYFISIDSGSKHVTRKIVIIK